MMPPDPPDPPDPPHPKPKKPNIFSQTTVRHEPAHEPARAVRAHERAVDASTPPLNKDTIERTIGVPFPPSVNKEEKDKIFEELLLKLNGLGRRPWNDYKIKTTGLKNFYTAIAIIQKFNAENIMYNMGCRAYYDERQRRGGGNDSDNDSDNDSNDYYE